MNNKSIKHWKVSEWTGESKNPAPMSQRDINRAMGYLRANNYPKPKDCRGDKCPGYRPACKMGVCHVAVQLCGDF